MASTRLSSNRGPGAAAENRRALLLAARRLFAERGYSVPLNAIAKAAGVGQGVLYRHFPRRLDLAFAVFEENFDELEAIAARAGPEAFEQLVTRVVELTLESFGFVELTVGERAAADGYDGGKRLAIIVDGPLDRARRAGRVAETVTVADIAIGLRMIYGVAVTSRDRVQRRAEVLHVHRWLVDTWKPVS